MTIGTIFLIFFSLLLLAGLLFAGVIAWLYGWHIARAQPRHEGAFSAACFEQEVEVLRDKHGVPTLYARTRADLFRAQGLVHAQDRFWQMEQARRTAHGTLAELFGEPALEADRFSRIVGFARAAQAELDALDADTRQVLTWYAEGVNAWLAARPGRIAAELNLLRAKPAAWQPLDTLAYAKLIAWGLSGNWESELARLRMLAAGDPWRVAELEPDLPAGTPLVTELPGEEQQRLVHAAGLLLTQLEPLKQWIGGMQHGQGSNAWAVAPSHSLTRKPIVAGDPHLPAQIPGIWYENHLCAPGFEVVGASFAGLPGVIMGHNEEIAWSLTNGSVDQQDLYIERADPADATRFEHAGGFEQAQVIDELIRVRRRAQPVTQRVVVTRHGPIITQLLPEGERANLPPMALRWVGHAPGHGIRAILALNAATTLEEFESALADWQAPAQNFVFADVRGNIAYRMAGQIPLREGHVGAVPAPGWTGAHEWTGMIPCAELPALQNPPAGLIVSANNKPVGDDYPHFLGLEFSPGWRAARITAMLGERERYSVRDMEEIQLDTQSGYAAELTRWLTLVSSDEPWEKTSIQALRKWNHRMEVDSLPALVFHYTLLQLLAMVFGDKLNAVTGAYLGSSITPIFTFSSHIDRAELKLLELLNSEEQSAWYMEMKSGRRRTRDELLAEALGAAVRELRKELGDSTLKWQWGRSHQVMYAHPLGSARLLRNAFNRGPIPIGGDNNSALQTRYTPRLPLGMVQVVPAYRQIIEVGAWDRMQSLTATGQSGHPLMSTYDDQMVMWREGVYHSTPWRRELVEKATVARMKLTSSTQGR